MVRPVLHKRRTKAEIDRLWSLPQGCPPVRYTLDLFCWDLPADANLRACLIASDSGEWYMTPGVDRYVKNGQVRMGTFLRTLEHYRNDVALCSEARVSLAYFPDRQQAESTTLIPSGVMKRLAACGVGLEVCTYPHGSDRRRYGGALHFVLARSAAEERSDDGGAEARDLKLPPSVRASLRARGLNPTAVMDYDITFAAQQEFIDRCIPDNEGISVFSLNKYLGEFMWPTFELSKEEVAALAAQGYDIEFHFDFPQRRGLRLRTIVRA